MPGQANIGYPPKMLRTFDMTPINCAVETLTRLDKASTPVPWLATGWKVSDDLKSITLTLQKGVKFHDGTDFNAQAAKWNLDNYIASKRSELKSVASVDVLDDSTIKLNLANFDNAIMANLSSFAGLMVSPTAYQKNGEAWALNNPVGTGPFKFVSWNKDVNIKFSRFDDYWQKGKPYLDGIEFAFVQDSLTQVMLLKSGGADVLLNVGAQQVADLQASGNFKVAEFMGGPIGGFVGDSANPNSPFANIKVRQAVSYAIDSAAIAKAMGYGHYVTTGQFGAPGFWWYNPDVAGYPYNPDKAKQLLTEAGYTSPLKTKLSIDTNPQNRDVFVAVQAYLKKVGVDAELEINDAGKVNDLVNKGWQNSMFVFLAGTRFDAVGTMASFLSARSPLMPSMLHPEDYEKAITEALATPDFKVKVAKTQEAQKLMVDKYALCTFLYQGSFIAAMKSNVNDTGIFEFSGNLYRPEDAWISK
jgi:peptide/nickel transport system substrate-binding protein